MKIIKNIPKLKPRAKEAHKGDFGKVCIIGGSIGMSGAAGGSRISADRYAEKRPADCRVD